MELGGLASDGTLENTRWRCWAMG